MKKILPLLLILVLISGCGSPKVTNIQGSATAATKPTSEVPQDLSSLVEIKEYSCVQVNYFMFYVMTIKNNSDKMLVADLNVTALDKDGNPLGGNNCSQEVIAPGQTACEWTTFDKDWQKITKFEHNLNIKESTKENVYKDLEVKTNKTSDSVAVSVKNNGATPAKFVEAEAMFFKDNKLVGFASRYCVDNDSEIKPGQTISCSCPCSNGAFDDVTVLINCK